jgi:hypothetical protein
LAIPDFSDVKTFPFSPFAIFKDSFRRRLFGLCSSSLLFASTIAPSLICDLLLLLDKLCSEVSILRLGLGRGALDLPLPLLWTELSRKLEAPLVCDMHFKTGTLDLLGGEMPAISTVCDKSVSVYSVII